MSILAHNIYKVFALAQDRCSELSNERIFEKFISNSGNVKITSDGIMVELTKKRDLPQLLEMMKNNMTIKYQWLNDLKINFTLSSTT